LAQLAFTPYAEGHEERREGHRRLQPLLRPPVGR
jgi:hypothetical protein